jgi:protein-tyrosine phosphatase
MVCLGNICRSPIAEELVYQKCMELGISVEVDSAGTAGYHIGKKPDSRMIETAAKFGYNISNLRARKFSKDDFEHFDFIFTMDNANYNDLIALTSKEHQRKKIFKFQDFAGVSVPDFVPDPYYGSMEDFEETFKIVMHSSELIAKKIKEIHENR